MADEKNDQINPAQERGNETSTNQQTGPTATRDIAPLPELLFDSHERDESDLDESLLEARRPSFFEWPMFEQLRRQPYHSVLLEGHFDLKALANDHRAQLFRSQAHFNEKGKPRLDRMLFNLGDGVFGYYDRPCFTLYAPSPEKAVELALQFRRYVRPPAHKQPGFHLLRLDGSYADTEFIPVKHLVTLSDDALTLHYGEDFTVWQQDWTERLSERRSGVSILSGPPGCGKTTYLRALMARLLGRCVFYYLPISEFEVLSNPHFVSFWVRESARYDGKQKIAILEDAEELLLPRDAGSRAKVSNLLNIGDGFLGDHLKLHVIATTNVPMQDLDAAVARPGRLLAAREFPRLSREAALRLAEAKGISSLAEQPDYSLADIYCRAPLAARLQKARRLGFA